MVGNNAVGRWDYLGLQIAVATPSDISEEDANKMIVRESGEMGDKSKVPCCCITVTAKAIFKKASKWSLNQQVFSDRPIPGGNFDVGKVNGIRLFPVVNVTVDRDKTGCEDVKPVVYAWALGLDGGKASYVQVGSGGYNWPTQNFNIAPLFNRKENLTGKSLVILVTADSETCYEEKFKIREKDLEGHHGNFGFKEDDKWRVQK